MKITFAEMIYELCGLIALAFWLVDPAALAYVILAGAFWLKAELWAIRNDLSGRQ